MEIGFNLYSIRNQIATPDGLVNACRVLAEQGYDAVQYSGEGYDPDLLCRVVEDSGLRVAFTHMPLARILDDTDALMAEHERFGCDSFGLGMMPPADAVDDDRVRVLTARLEERAAYVARRGFTLCYHNHSFEFRRMADGQTIFDYMIASTSALRFVPDTYWLQYGGVCITEYIGKLAGRCPAVHLKDYCMNGWEPHYTHIGGGNLNWRAILSAFGRAGARLYIVEQDDATDYTRPFDEAAASISYLRHLCEE